MKLNKIIYFFSAIVTLGTLNSCEKYLDQNPDMRTEINSVDKVAQLVTSAYPRYNYLAMAETYSDNVNDKGPTVGHNNDPFVSLYFWDDLEDDGNNTPTQYWNGVYEGIAAANQALEAIETGDFGSDVLPYKGEALVARAYGHFMLVTFFAKAYVPGAANDSPGIPYVKMPEKVALAQYERGTVASVYAQIEKDLEEGLALLRGGEWKVPKYHFTHSAASAFASRFYLFKGEFDKVIQHTNAIFQGGDFNGNLRPANTTFRTYTLAEFNQELTMANKNYNLLLCETYSVYQRSNSSGTARYGFGTDKYSGVYNATTVAGAPFYNKGVRWSDNNYTVYIFKEYFHYTNVQAQIGFPYIMQPLFIADEALMNRAEAAIEIGDYAAAIRDLNLFASVRITNYNPQTHAVTLEKARTFFNEANDKEALIKTVLQFKQIGFMGEGLRWFDILRKRIPVIHNHIDAAGVETFQTLSAEDNRRMFQIPQEATIAGIELNPR
ncbi:RagB/SusD family nutrient uptake outer membrane protein [Sphingobacterium paludis]|uniref:SusD-like starch-binding protein associating with outer membrane n=1 Tax=Sphingobacterium paludis TaxID=1476465 RepID=A0A4R7D159_9SPHI|nr:RagB/SusD family nutrient uptake outer membrane protein [Sphingobacterium paludis]TDS13972.1 SusD-like starch-binding protein associating with outer membrane [Sphingobacterium paludis]